MAITEACQVWIEQRVEEELGTGKSYRAIGREIAKEIEKVFQAKVNPSALERRAERSDKKSATNVAPLATISLPTEIPENQSRQPDKPRKHIATGNPMGGERECAGRPPKTAIKKEDIVGAEFEESFKSMLRAVTNAKRTGWKETSQEAVIRHLGMLYDIATIK